MVPDPLGLLVAAALSYGLGALPFSAWAARLRGVDIQAVGSGNPGATNVARSVGPAWGALVLAADLAKGLAAVGVCAGLQAPPTLAGLAVVGHNWSAFLRWRGGKGVATTLGVLVGLSWAAALLTVGVWVALAGLTRKVSVGSLAALVGAPLVLLGVGASLDRVLLLAGLGLLGVLRHRRNLVRLWRGEELSPLGGQDGTR